MTTTQPRRENQIIFSWKWITDANGQPEADFLAATKAVTMYLCVIFMILVSLENVKKCVLSFIDTDSRNREINFE